jgi:hypothetical protein
MKNNLIYVEIVKINNTIHNTQKTPPPQTWFYATTMTFALMAWRLYKMVCTRLVVEPW